MVIGIIFPNQIIGIFNKDAQVVALGGRYLVVVALSYVFTAISFSFAFASRSIENSFLPMMASIVALLINIVGNYILIFGKFGVEAMGVEGAAWATVFARIIETIIIITYVYYKKMPIKVNLSNLLHIDTKFLNMSMKGITPILVNEIVWGLGNVTYNIIYSRLGVSAAATIQITTTVLNLLMIVIFALGSSAMIIVGQEIGRGDIARGRTYAKKLYKLALKVGIFVGIIVYFVAPYVVLFFNMSSAVLKSSEIILKINSIALMFRTYNFIMIVGILRGGGDAKFGLILQGITMWFIGIPLVYLAAFIFKLPIYYVVLFCTVEEIVKLIFLSIRFNSGKWIKDITGSSKDRETQLA